MQAALEFSVTPQLHKHHLVQEQAHQVQRLGHGAGGRSVLDISHSVKENGVVSGFGSGGRAAL